METSGLPARVDIFVAKASHLYRLWFWALWLATINIIMPRVQRRRQQEIRHRNVILHERCLIPVRCTTDGQNSADGASLAGVVESREGSGTY